MPYTAPDRAALRESIARDLRDPRNALEPENQTFTDVELNDLINLSLVEVSRVYPKALVTELAVELEAQRSWDCDAYSLFRVELIKASLVYSGIPVNSHEETGEGGWDLHGGTLYLPAYAVSQLTPGEDYSVRIWGYFPRELFTIDPVEGDLEHLDGDAETEYAVRTFSVLSGYQRLQNDRLLFQQWLTNTGNTDVSPNQLGQLADLYLSQWREMRNRLRSLQRQ